MSTNSTIERFVGSPFCSLKPMNQRQAILGMQLAATMTFAILSAVSSVLLVGGAIVTNSHPQVSSALKTMSMGFGAAASAATISSYMKAQELCIRKMIR